MFFLVFMVNLLPLHQFAILSRSACKFKCEVQISQHDSIKTVSSAYKNDLQWFKQFLKSFMYTKNNYGPKIGPYGTPHSIFP